MLRTKSYFSFLFAFILLSSKVTAQTKKEQIKKDTTKYCEVGTDLLWLIDKNQLPATSLFTRYNYINKHSDKRALRLRIGFDHNVYDSSQVSNLEPRSKNTFSLFCRPGLEFQKNISNDAVLYYGLDTHFLLFKQHFYYILSSTADPNIAEGKLKTLEFGLSPLIGFKYSPISWCAISIESTLNATYRIKRDKSQTGTVAYPGGGKGERNVDDFTINITPIAVINFSYLINKKAK